VLAGGMALTLLGAAYVRAVLRRREDQQLASEQLFTLAATAPGAMYAFRLRPDGTSCFPYASPRITELFGIVPADVLADSAPAFNRVHPEDIGRLLATITDSSKTLAPWKSTFRAFHPTKGWIWIEGSSMPMREPGGAILWHGFLIDVTERQRAEQALHESEQRFQEAGEAAQGRIARDLHDGLGQQLGGVLYLGRLLYQDLRAHDAPEAEKAAELNRLVKAALELTRNVARGLHPVPAQPDGLMLALEALIEQAGAGGEVRFIFECESPVLVDDVRVASQLYRIAQEAVNNSLKHSGGTRIEVALWQESDALILRVRDNGIGLAHGPVGHGLGLHSMRHRARLIGATLETGNGEAGGAVVTCRVPRASGVANSFPLEAPVVAGNGEDSSEQEKLPRPKRTGAIEPIP
jgi:PAS domain S-box-containing protein